MLSLATCTHTCLYMFQTLWTMDLEADPTLLTTVQCGKTYYADGRYGELGICNDSVAMLQLAERGETQVANTGGTGVARQRLTVVATGMRQTALEVQL